MYGKRPNLPEILRWLEDTAKSFNFRRQHRRMTLLGGEHSRFVSLLGGGISIVVVGELCFTQSQVHCARSFGSEL